MSLVRTAVESWEKLAKMTQLLGEHASPSLDLK